MSRCPVCDGDDLHPFYRVERVPVQSALLFDDRHQARSLPTGALDLVLCRTCGFIHNRRFDPALTSYTVDYEDMQGFSPRWRRFAGELIDEEAARYALAGRTVLEIGCGKGEFLALMCARTGSRGIGFDPAWKPGRDLGSAADRLTFHAELFGADTPDQHPDYVCCRHTLEHEPRPLDLLGTIRRHLDGRPEVPLMIEVPDTLRILEEQAFWDIYYEHCGYFTAGSLARLLERSGFRVDEVRTVYDRQYLVALARPSAGTPLPTPSPSPAAALEPLVERFAAEVGRKLEAMRAAAAEWRRQGRRVVVWGSGSKAVGYLTTLGLDDEVQAVVDINPHRHGRFVPATGHPIVSPNALKTLRPSLVLIMNPIYADEIGQELARQGLAPEMLAV